MQNTNNLLTLSKKYCEGTCSAEEMAELASLLKDSNVAKQEFKSYCQDWQNNHKMDSIEEYALASLMSRIEEPRRRWALRTSPVWAYSTAFACIAALVLTLVFGSPFSRNQELFYSVSATMDNATVVNLPDASKIHLMDGGKLVYSSEFSAQRRSVDFEGNAYFDISSDKNHPFVVNVGKSQIKVYGTKFDVSSTSEDLTVTLVKGSVELDTPSKSITLVPGDKVSYNSASGSMDVRHVNPDSYMALMEGNLEYYNVTLSELAEYLGDIYSREIILSAKLASNEKRYNLRLVNHESFVDVISALRLMVPMSIRTEGSRVWLTEK